LYSLTFSTLEWLDVFTRKRYKDIVVESLAYCQQEKGLELYSWVLMSNHIHLIARAKASYKFLDILRDFNKHASKQIIKLIEEEPESSRDWLLVVMLKAGVANGKNSKYQLWRKINHPIELYSNEVINHKIDYIHNNPEIEGMVERTEN